MQNFGKWLGAGAIVVAGLTGVAGCNSQGDANGVVADQVVNNVASAASNVANAAAGTASNVANAAAGTANNVAAAASNVASAAGAPLKTAEIKAKIIANPSLNNPKNNINVESDATTVTLKGAVQNAAQKTLAENIAKANAGGRTVKNELTAAAAPKM